MRIATITAKTKDGQWVTLAQPDVSIQEQKAYMKQLKAEGGVIQLNGKAVELEAVEMFVSGSGKKVKFKPAPVEEASTEQGVKNLADLQAAVGIEDKKEFDALRQAEGFPGEKDENGCFDVEACRKFIADLIVTANLENIAAHVGVEPEKLAELMELDGFPEKLSEESGWQIGQVRAFVDAQGTEEED